MAKRYLGYGYTNAQGVAKLEYDADGEPLTHSYTGVGAGKIDIVAESGTLQSESYTIIDAILSDINGVGNIDYTNPTSATISRSSGYTSITASTVGTVSYCNISTNHSSAYNFKDIGGFAVEFDLLEYTGDSLLEVNGHDGTTRTYITSRNFEETGHYQYFFEPTEQYVIVNGARISLNTKTLANYTNYIYVSIDTKNNVKLNNLVVYPI